MVKMTHPKMMRGKDTQSTVSTPQTYVVDNTQSYAVDSTYGANEQADNYLDQRIAEFEGHTEPVENSLPLRTSAPNHVVKKNIDIEKVLEQLIFIGRHTKELEIAGHKFEMSTLTHRENNDIVAELMGIGDAVDLFTIRLLTLAYALRKIDGVPLDDINMGDVEFKDNLQKRMTIVDYLQLGLVERLHKAYEDLVKESESVVFGENVKN